MAVDIRAITTCSLGPLVSADINDSFIQGAGVVTTTGSCVISGIISPRMGKRVVFQYSKGGVTRTIPRRMRVISSFADPFKGTTTVELGCKFTYLQDLAEPFDWEALADPEGIETLVESDVFIPPFISARSIARICLEELGLSHEPIPLQSRFTIPEFEFGAPYVQILGDLLSSEGYYAWINALGEVRFGHLDGTDKDSGPRLSGNLDIVSIAPIGSGQPPAETVVVNYSNTRLVAPSLEDGTREPWGWELEYTTSTPQTVYMNFTIPGMPRRSSWGSTPVFSYEMPSLPGATADGGTSASLGGGLVPNEDLPVFEIPEDETVGVEWTYVPETITKSKYDPWGRLVKRIRITTRIFAEANSDFLSQLVEAATAPAELEGSNEAPETTQAAMLPPGTYMPYSPNFRSWGLGTFGDITNPSKTNTFTASVLNSPSRHSSYYTSFAGRIQMFEGWAGDFLEVYSQYLDAKDAYNEARQKAWDLYMKGANAVSVVNRLGDARDVQYEFERYNYKTPSGIKYAKVEGYDTVLSDEKYTYVSRAAALGSMSVKCFDERGFQIVGCFPQKFERTLIETAYPKYTLEDRPKLRRKLIREYGLRSQADRIKYLARDDEDWLQWDEFIRQKQIEDHSDTILSELVVNRYSKKERNLVIDELVEDINAVPLSNGDTRKRIGYSPVTKTVTEVTRLAGNTERGQQALQSLNQQSDWYANSYRVGGTAAFRALTLVDDGTTTTLSAGRESAAQIRPPDSEAAISDLLKDGTLYQMKQSTSAVLAMGFEDDQRRIEFTLPYAPDDYLKKEDSTWYVREANAEQIAREYGITQDRLLLGNRYGMTIQVAPERMPGRPFSPIFIDINGYRIMYRTNGTSWSMTADGVLCGTDAMYWGVVGTV